MLLVLLLIVSPVFGVVPVKSFSAGDAFALLLAGVSPDTEQLMLFCEFYCFVVTVFDVGAGLTNGFCFCAFFCQFCEE